MFPIFLRQSRSVSGQKGWGVPRGHSCSFRFSPSSCKGRALKPCSAAGKIQTATSKPFPPAKKTVALVRLHCEKLKNTVAVTETFACRKEGWGNHSSSSPLCPVPPEHSSTLEASGFSNTSGGQIRPIVACKGWFLLNHLALTARGQSHSSLSRGISDSSPLLSFSFLTPLPQRLKATGEFATCAQPTSHFVVSVSASEWLSDVTRCPSPLTLTVFSHVWCVMLKFWSEALTQENMQPASLLGHDYLELSELGVPELGSKAKENTKIHWSITAVLEALCSSLVTKGFNHQPAMLKIPACYISRF